MSPLRCAHGETSGCRTVRLRQAPCASYFASSLWQEISTYLLLALFLFPAGLRAAGTPLSPSPQEAPIFVRVNGTRVHFRESLPQTKEREDIGKYADPKATYAAYDKKQGEVAGYSGDWFWLVNHAHDEDRGWVAAHYVEAINPAEAARLERLGSSPEKSDSPWLQLWGNVVGIVNGLIGIGAAIISIMTSKWLIKRFAKYLGGVRTRQRARVDVPSPEARPFPRAVPSPPLSMGPSSRHEPPIIYGISHESYWIHRTRKRQQ